MGCERRYYYQYLSRARVNSPESQLREIAWLKQLKSIPAWSGSVFHAQAERLLRSNLAGAPLAFEELASEVDRDMRANWEWSRSASARRPSRTEGRVPLFEHEYGSALDEGSRDRAIQNVVDWLKALVEYVDSSGLLKSLRESARRWIEPPLFGSGAATFELDGVTIYTKVDLAFLGKDGGFRIVEWKTGRPPTRRGWQPLGEFQVGIYKLWPHLALGVAPERIAADLVYISEHPPLVQRTGLTAEDRDLMLSNVRRSIARMKQFAEAQRHGLDLLDLSYAIAPGLCSFCNFKGPCRRTLDGGLEDEW